MEQGTYGSVTNHPALIAIYDMVDKLVEKERNYISSFFNDFNYYFKNIQFIKDRRFRVYVINTMREDYKVKVKILETKYEKRLCSHIQNYIFGKLREELSKS